jgi:hypothetical protein
VRRGKAFVFKLIGSRHQRHEKAAYPQTASYFQVHWFHIANRHWVSDMNSSKSWEIFHNLHKNYLLSTNLFIYVFIYLFFCFYGIQGLILYSVNTIQRKLNLFKTSHGICLQCGGQLWELKWSSSWIMFQKLSCISCSKSHKMIPCGHRLTNENVINP